MFALLGDIKLWSCDDNISIKDTDFGAFRYYDKKTDGAYNEAKRSYCHNRGVICTPQNKKGHKLKDGLKYLEDQLRDHTVILSVWQDQNTLQLMVNTGLLIYIQVNVPTGDISKITFDKYLIGKVPDHLSDAIITRDNCVCTQNDSQVTIVHFAKPRRQVFDKIGKLEPKLVTVDLSGPSGRRIEKKIRVNRTGDLVLIWWKSTTNDVYPWSPAMKEYDRANVHLYRLRGVKFELLCYLRTEFDPLCITFNSRQENVIHSIEQKVSRKGEVTIEWQTYQVSQQDKLQRIEVISIALPTHTSCAKFSPNQDMLLLCCIDGSIILHDHTKGTNSSIKAGFIPTLATWHSDGFLFTVGNERGQCQHYDISLSCVKSQILNEESTQTNVLDLSSYFKSQPALIQMSWCRRVDDEIYNERYKNREALLLLSFERGPLGVIRVVDGNDLSGDVLALKYLNLLLPDRATSLLLSMNWDTHPRICMHSLNQILNHLFKLQLTPERENLIQNALGSFHVPVRPISQTVEDEYGDEIRDLTRRFFHHLMRYRLFEKAFRLAIDLNDHDLFMDIHYYALVVNDLEMARAAKEKAELVLSRSNSCSSSHSTCSRPSCSLCSDSASGNDSESYSEESESESPQRRPMYTKNCPSQIPPLPILSSEPFNSNPLISTSFNEIPPQSPQISRIPSSISKFLPPGKSHNYKLQNTNQFVRNSGPSIESSSQMSQSSPLLLQNSNPFVNTDSQPRNSGALSQNFGPVARNSGQNLPNSFPNISASFANLKVSEIYGREPAQFKLSDRFLPSEATKNPDNKEMSTKFDEMISVDIPNSVEYSFMNLDSNMTSTSFNVDESQKLEEKSSPDTKSSENFADVSKHFFSSENNLVSTSFNEEVGDPEESNEEAREPSEVPPPPPEMTSSLATYLSNLPRKNLPISRSIDELVKFPRAVQTQSSVSAILQNRRRINFGNSRTYRFNYDFDFVQDITYSGSCDNLRYFGANTKFRGGGKSPARDGRSSNVPPLPVLGKSGAEAFSGSEKPKVKFSNTVTHILVPGSGQGYRPLQKRPMTKLHPMDPKRELAESLPLCLGNEDYLKDFQPLSKDSGGEDKSTEPAKTEELAKIKVVHFGLL